ncbi:MAG: protein kinase [Bacteroides sp.]|nr:protein kinase [Bacteroides sp.]
MSEFLKCTDDYTVEYPSEINLDTAVRLPEGGSTCDIYRTKWQRRDVFVKRLKEMYRSNPLYLDALDKEFDIGAQLRHPSLPVYHEFHRDYIVLDYIDGQTLAEMIERQDPWLTKEKNIIRMLKDLVDVVGYLHQHNIAHCDIKPDNIMITANGRNLVLIDFDKSYTDALNDTSGHPGKYGLTADAKGRFAIDFRGIGMVAEKLKAGISGFKFRRYSRFVKACNSADVNCDELSAILAYSQSGARLGVKAVGVSVGIAAIILAIAYLLKPVDNEPAKEEIVDIEPEVEQPKVDSAAGVNGESAAHEAIVQPQTTAPKPPSASVSQKDESEDLNYRFAILCNEVQPYFDELIDALNSLDSIKNDTTLTRNELREHWKRYSDLNHKNIGVVMDKTHHVLYDIKVEELGDYLSVTPAYKCYMARFKEVSRAFHRELDSRKSR